MGCEIIGIPYGGPPPIHPNCLCVPFVDDDDDDDFDGLAIIYCLVIAIYLRRRYAIS